MDACLSQLSFSTHTGQDPLPRDTLEQIFLQDNIRPSPTVISMRQSDQDYFL